MWVKLSEETVWRGEEKRKQWKTEGEKGGEKEKEDPVTDIGEVWTFCHNQKRTSTSSYLGIYRLSLAVLGLPVTEGALCQFSYSKAISAPLDRSLPASRAVLQFSLLPCAMKLSLFSLLIAL